MLGREAAIDQIVKIRVDALIYDAQNNTSYEQEFSDLLKRGCVRLVDLEDRELEAVLDQAMDEWADRIADWFDGEASDVLDEMVHNVAQEINLDELNTLDDEYDQEDHISRFEYQQWRLSVPDQVLARQWRYPARNPMIRSKAHGP